MTISYEQMLQINAKVTKEFKKKKLNAREQAKRDLKQRADDVKFNKELENINNEYS